MTVRDDERLAEVRAVFDSEIGPRLAAHMGGANVTGVDDEGVVDIEFTGACTACAYRKNTILGAIFPRLRTIEGVTSVSAPGVAVPAAQQRRVAAQLDKYATKH